MNLMMGTCPVGSMPPVTSRLIHTGPYVQMAPNPPQQGNRSLCWACPQGWGRDADPQALPPSAPLKGFIFQAINTG